MATRRAFDNFFVRDSSAQGGVRDLGESPPEGAEESRGRFVVLTEFENGERSISRQMSKSEAEGEARRRADMPSVKRAIVAQIFGRTEDGVTLFEDVTGFVGSEEN